MDATIGTSLVTLGAAEALAVADKLNRPLGWPEQRFLVKAPAVGAVCLNRARTDLCGGRLATAVPTAIATRFGPGVRRGPADGRQMASADRIGMAA